MLKRIKKHFHYLNYVLLHKYYVTIECFKQGLIWRGIVHDWTKFLPNEWFPYVEYFYGGYTKDARPKHVTDAFKYAWKHHYRFNDHHWQHWSLCNSAELLRMPYKAVIEMLCDWKGASMAKGKGDTWTDVYDWYRENRDSMFLNEETRHLVQTLLHVLRWE